MNSTTMKGNWMTIKGKIKEKWGKLTDDDLDVMDGKMEQLAGTVAKRYGCAKEEAQRQVDEFNRSCDASCH